MWLAINSHTHFFIYTQIVAKSIQKILHYSVTAGSPLWEQEPVLVPHTEFLL